MARLLIFDEAVRGVDLPLHPVVVGRSRKIDIPIRDAMLSRKHCGIVPLESGFRLLDLCSANGTYVNGARIDKFDLSYDDVIEIGNTVLVFVDTDRVPSGQGLARLRNPRKARELIEKVNRRRPREVQPRAGTPDRSSGASPGRSRTREVETFKDALLAGGATEGVRSGGLQVLLEEYILHELVSAAVRSSPDLRKVVGQVVDQILGGGSVPEDLSALRCRVGEVLAGLLGQGGETQPTDSHGESLQEGESGKGDTGTER